MAILAEQWAAIPSPHICVIGDIILDRYHWGTADRISPEAPVLVLRSNRDEDRLGGAASVASLLRGLECRVTLIGVIGDDLEASRVRTLAVHAGISSDMIEIDPARPTTCKSRILGQSHHRSPHQLLRIDRESHEQIDDSIAEKLIHGLKAVVDDVSAILLSDYGKGVCTPSIVRSILEIARTRDIPVLVDPAKGTSFENYRQSTILTPNRIEASAAAGRRIATVSEAGTIGTELCNIWELKALILKLDRDGLVVCRPNFPPHVVRSVPHNVCDVTGAGDMILAVLGMCLASGWEICDSAEAANIAGGLEVEQVGVTAITRQEIQRTMGQRMRVSSQHKIVSAQTARQAAEQYRRDGRRVVFTNGCFDLLHAGHIHCLEQAAAQGDLLFVAVNDDAGVRRLKGHGRPIIEQIQRLSMVAALGCVDHAILMEAETPHNLLNAIRPHVLVKGAPYSLNEVVGAELVRTYGGTVVLTDAFDGASTLLAQKIKDERR